jgi:hypothetical protein
LQPARVKNSKNYPAFRIMQNKHKTRCTTLYCVYNIG